MESWNILEILPPEVMILVFSNLEAEDIVSSLSVSKLWNALHNGFNWKEAFSMTFGELSSSIVDVTQKFNWRKLFFDRKTLSSMGKRIKINDLIRRKLNPKKDSFCIRAVTKDNVIYSIDDNYYNIDLRLLKQDPTLSKDKLIPSTATLTWAKFSYDNTNNTNTNNNNNKHYDNLIIEFYGHLPANQSAHTNEPQTDVFAFWQLKKGVKALSSVVLPSEAYTEEKWNKKYAMKTPSVTRIGESRIYDRQTFRNVNIVSIRRIYHSAKYILWTDRDYSCLFDTSKRCYHYCDFQKKGQIYEREKFSTTCVNKEKCAIKQTWSEYDWYPFLSTEDPDLIVGVQVKNEDYELVISRIGKQQRTEIFLDKVNPFESMVKIGSEHVIRSRKKIVKHWFSFEINNELYFIDLIDTTRKFKTAIAPKYEWIPNESKVAVLTYNCTLSIFDLETASRCSKLILSDRSDSIKDFSVLPNRGFIAVLGGNQQLRSLYITIYHWETAAQARSIDVSKNQVSTIQFISESLLLMCSNTYMGYIKL